MKTTSYARSALLLGAAATTLLSMSSNSVRAEEYAGQQQQQQQQQDGGSGGGETYWDNLSNVFWSCDFPTDEVDAEGTIVFLQPILCSEPQVREGSFSGPSHPCHMVMVLGRGDGNGHLFIRGLSAAVR